MSGRSGGYALAALVLLLGCATSHASPRVPLSTELHGSDGRTHSVRKELKASSLTVFVFYSKYCPTVRAHEGRLKQLAAKYRDQKVTVWFVNSEIGATEAEDAREARARSYPFVLLTDPHGQLARRLGAEFAAHALVVDAAGFVRYSGAIDSDRNVLQESATHYLKNALEDLLLGRPVRADGGEALGCALQLR